MEVGDQVTVKPTDGAPAWVGTLTEVHYEGLCWFVRDAEGKEWDCLATILS